eukprot:6094102-Prymnesium_polylepis.1
MPRYPPPPEVGPCAHPAPDRLRSAPFQHEMVDYSRFDGIGDDSDDEDEGAPAPATPPRRPHTPQPPTNVMEDLEDYFRRIEERQARNAAASASDSGGGVPSVDRFTPEQIEALPSVVFEAAGASYSECSVCLGDFAPGDRLTRLPCAAGHLLHPACAAECLARSVFCPLCRVDLAAIVPRSQAAAEEEVADEAPPTPRQLGFTRDGGVILRYEPTPPAEMPRPSYIPAESRAQASFVEIEYPERGVARVWRVPRQRG